MTLVRILSRYLIVWPNMSRLKILFFTFLLTFPTSCATTDKIMLTPDRVKIENDLIAEKELIPYINRFIEQSDGKYQKIGNNVIIRDLAWGRGTGNTVGLCNWGTNTISIDQSYWMMSSEIERESLIFHEFGHCTMNRMHTDTKEVEGSIYFYFDEFMFWSGILEKRGLLKDGCPGSLMHPYTIATACLVKHRDYYQKELFDETGEFYRVYADEDEDEEAIYTVHKNIFMETVCQDTVVENKSGDPWNEIDDDNMEYARARCPVVTKLDCLKKFTKMEHLVYRAICGAGTPN